MKVTNQFPVPASCFLKFWNFFSWQFISFYISSFTLCLDAEKEKRSKEKKIDFKILLFG